VQASRIITDYRLSRNGSIFAGEMYSTICVEWSWFEVYSNFAFSQYNFNVMKCNLSVENREFSVEHRL